MKLNNITANPYTTEEEDIKLLNNHYLISGTNKLDWYQFPLKIDEIKIGDWVLVGHKLTTNKLIVYINVQVTLIRCDLIFYIYEGKEYYLGNNSILGSEIYPSVIFCYKNPKYYNHLPFINNNPKWVKSKLNVVNKFSTYYEE